MKFHTRLLAAALLLGGTQVAFAADLGTNANTNIVNQATVNFSVNGTAQTASPSNQAEFVVDRKVDVLVAKTADASGAPLATNKALAFNVTNKTNDTLDFILSLEQLTGDDFNALSPAIWVDTNGNGTLDLTDPDGAGPLAADSQQEYIDNLGEDVTVKVWVVANFPDSGTDPGEVQDGDTADIALQAQAAAPTGSVGSPGAALAETAGADQPTVVDNVFADASGTATGDADQDGKHSDTGTYTIGAASVTVSKTMKVVFEDAANSENLSENTNTAYAANLKPIPGALIEYCILVTNTGGQAATDVTITDPLDVDPTTGHLTWVAGSIRTGTTCDYTAGTAEDDDKTGQDPDGAGPLTTDEGGPAPTGDLIGADYGITTAEQVTATATNVPATTGAFAVMFQLIVR